MKDEDLFQSISKINSHSYFMPVGRAAWAIFASLKIHSINKKQVIAMPSFICQSVVAAAIAAGWEIMFLDININNANVSSDEYLRAIQENKIDAILFVHLFGNKKFVKKAISSGVDGLIIVDLPVEEDKELFLESEKNNLRFIRLITPTTNLERVKKITKNAKGFIYYVAVAGITGAKSALKRDVEKKIKQIKTITNLPIIIGFGIKKPSQATEMSKLGNGIVIGSSLVEKIKKTKSFSKITHECINFVKTFATKF